MWQLRIDDMQLERNFLAVDLRHVLRALGHQVFDAVWSISGMQDNDEELFATGEGASELEALAVSGERVPGSLFLEISERTHQVIWGNFRAFLGKGETPWLRIAAHDSTWYEVVCEDRVVIDRIASAFMHTSITFLPEAGR